MSALNASPENFVHKALKDEQIDCVQRVVWHGRDVLAVLPTGLGKRAFYQLTSKVLFRMGRIRWFQRDIYFSLSFFSLAT